MRSLSAVACLTAFVAALGCGSSSDESPGGTIDSGAVVVDSASADTGAADTGSATDSTAADTQADSDDSATVDSSKSDGAADAAGTSCGGLAGKSCPSGYFCRSAPGTCMVADIGGTCVAVPDSCEPGGAPVCGCDGTTYTDCSAVKAGVNVDHTGACAPSGKTCGGKLGGTCGPTEYCDFPVGAMCGAADASGVCTPRPSVCFGAVVPACGCDGMTYTNSCKAHAAGVDDSHAGDCP